jgi:hypothetical protein
MQKSRPSRKLYIFIRRLLVLPLLFLTMFFLVLYLTAPQYFFVEPKPFEGSYINNPYKSLDTNSFRTTLFSAPEVPLGTIIIGDDQMMLESIQNEFQEFDHVEMVMRQKLFRNEIFKSDKLYSYQHGLGFANPSMFCIGARKNLWIDYPLFKNIHHKQGLIEKLLNDCDMVALNPASFTAEEIKYLSGYQLIDLGNNTKNAAALWDSALSNGHLVYGFATEKEFGFGIHNSFNVDYLVVNPDFDSTQALMDAIKQGSSYVVTHQQDLGVQRNHEKLASERPFLVSAFLNADTFYVSTSQTASFFKFISQKGKLLHLDENTSSASCVFGAEDNYMRVEIVFPDGTKFFLNPLTRHFTANTDKQNLASIDVTKTALMRGVYIILIVILLQIIFKWQMSKLKIKNTNERM